MLTLFEKILFILAALATLYAAYWVVNRIAHIIKRGQGKIDWSVGRKRAISALKKVIILQPTWQIRIGPSILHALVAWAFLFYLLINTVDALEALLTGFSFSEALGSLGGPFRLTADLLSVGALIGMGALLLRRFVAKSPDLTARKDIFINPKARSGIRRDSAIVGAFIIIHIGSRFLGQSVAIAEEGGDVWQPFASAVANLWTNFSAQNLAILSHIFFWLAIGTIMAFIPYFLYSKHIHLFFAPLNFSIKPERRSMGALSPLDFEDESIEQFGAARLEDLGWEQLMDGYACIMCNRCQQVCPAYNTGKVLSPAALEINKRYFMNYEGARLAKGEPSEKTLLEFMIKPEAIWACTTCGACIEICPLGNEPMRDIIDIRRDQVLMENNFPEQLQTAFRGMERTYNPWNVSSAERMKWAEGLNVPTVDQNPDPDILWWVGCAPSTDARAQKTARAFAEILNTAGVNYAVLGEKEQCTGDSARRAGNEYLFYELATANVEMLNEVSAPRIVTTCPHCLHTIQNEYPDFGGNYQVVHHTQLIEELISNGKLKVKGDQNASVTFHDPCYLGRQNGIYEEPRQLINAVGDSLIEMPQSHEHSFCCGAGGAQMWKEEEEGTERINTHRFHEAQETGADVLAVGCPFCMIMLDDAKKDANSEMQVLDVAEILVKQLENEVSS